MDPSDVGSKGKAAYDAAESSGSVKSLMATAKKAASGLSSVASKVPSRLKQDGEAMELDEIKRRFDVTQSQARIVRGIQKATGINPGSAAFDMAVGLAGVMVERRGQGDD